MAFPVLETERLKLEEVHYGYTKELYDILGRRDVMKYYGMDPVVSYEETARVIEKHRTNYMTCAGIRWVMIQKDTDQCIGTIGLNELRISSRRAETGFEIHPFFSRQGYGSEALTEVIRYAFDELGLYRIGAVTFPENEASSRLLQKCGFRFEGTLRGYLYQRGESHDAHIYSILRSDT
ncbi:GNAT family N-acetyltransferase [Alteribacter natronophilus]|uniref:GNAT family N-acetyltransferase n=1 Tax=Alteribacter natronophilus TaxID=2583810 RepID=UPI001486A5A6|nr:GNAT family protein [Alteribacter natronophilus]